MAKIPGEKLVRQIAQNDARRVDFDLDNWINDVEDGFTRFTKINPNFKEHYWGQGFSNRPRIKELNEQADAQKIEGYRVVEFFPDRDVEDESYILFGTPLEIMSQISFFMNMKLMLKGSDMGTWVGYPLDEYLRNKPRRGLTVQIFLTTYKRPPYYQIGTKWYSRRRITIPLVDRAKLTYQAIRNACGGSQGQNWGEWVARAYVSGDDDNDSLRKIVVGGSTEEKAIQNLEKFLIFTQGKVRKISAGKTDHSKGDYALDPNRNRYNSFDVYPAWITVWNSKLIELDDKRHGGKKTLSGKMLSRHNKLFTYPEKEPKNWSSTVQDIVKKVENA